MPTAKDVLPAIPSALSLPETFSNSSSSNQNISQFINALWRSPGHSHQIGALDRHSKKFRNIPVKDFDEAISKSVFFSDAGLDTYIALAEYKTSDNRTATNVTGAYAFWGDIDCGLNKAVSGKGYINEDEALIALQEFCKRACLPMPTFIIASGGGLHVYWVLDSFISCEKWQSYAIKIKALNHALSFLADDTRTADIASVLRMPGTLNHKYKPPRAVTLKQASSVFIEQSVFFDAIDEAHDRLCKSVTSNQLSKPELPNHPPELQSSIIAKLKKLLKHIDPNCGYEEWLRVLMALYYETGGSEEGFVLANAWSSNGSTYKDIKEIRIKWNSFKLGSDNPITIATLIKMSKDNGMKSFDDFKALDHCNTEITAPTLQSIKPLIEAVNPLTKYSLLDRSDEVERQTVAQVPVMGNIALMGQSTIIYAAPNTGKTLITLSLLIEGIKQGRIDSSKLYYLNMDDSGAGLLIKLRMAEEYRFHMLADGYRDFKIADFLSIIEEMVEKNQARGVIIVLDTLKKFVDLMDKRNGSSFGKIIRNFIAKGGTHIALAHTNKNRGANGKPIYGGTSDIVDDCDCAYTIALVSDEHKKKVVEFDNIKRRGDVAQTVAYSYTSENGVSYDEILLSVQLVDELQIEPMKQAAAIKADTEIIEVVIACIANGVNTKMKLANAVADRASTSKRSALNVIEKYTGNDPLQHRWNFSVGERGAKRFVLLDLISSNTPLSVPDY